MTDTTSQSQTPEDQADAEIIALKCEARGAAVAYRSVLPETTTPILERREAIRTDRRKYSRSVRRDHDPRVNWRRWAWLFAGYALFMSIRSLPLTVKRKLFERSKAVPS